MLRRLDAGPLTAASVAILLAIVLGVMALVGLTAPASDPQRAAATAGTGLRGFTDPGDLTAFASKMAALERRQMAVFESAPPPMYSMSVDVAAPMIAAPAEAAPEESITNTQEAGVDEGGIVKRAGDYLVVLRRGRLFTIRVGDDALTPVGMVDAFPPGKSDPDRTWYDEMLIHGSQIIVIGYSYGGLGTEINRFDIGAGGALSYRDTHYLPSGDYYSSSNYAARLIGDELVVYTPKSAHWQNLEMALPVITGRDPGSKPKPLVKPQDFLVAEPYRDGRWPIDTLHIVTRCKLTAADLDCTATAIAGTWSHAFYVARDAVYVWTGMAEDYSGLVRRAAPGQLYRIPLGGGTAGAVQVSGAPVDQFSFAEDAEAGMLRVLLRSEGGGEGMFASEVSGGSVALASVPFTAFGNGEGVVPRARYRDLPRPEGWRFHNRFVGDWVLYAAGEYGDETTTPVVHAVPLGGGAVQKIAMSHGVTRFDRMGADAIVVGPARGQGLGFTALSLGAEARIADSYLLPASSEGETRSQAFFFRPDPGSGDGASGILGLPVSRKVARNGAEFLGSGSAIAFLRRDARRFNPAGELAAAARTGRNDNCKASCVDWYGNARPIFLGDRIIALMGYELVEGTLAAGRIAVRRRVSFAP